MPTITINGRSCAFTPGQMILQVANDHGIAVPQYCYHDGLSIVASCRICLAEIWAPNPRNNNALEPWMGGKLHPTCQTPAADGMVVYTDSPKAVANQKAVMEYLLINHPLDCPVCDQAGECFLQDYSYQYGRGVSRFEETKVKHPKKDLGPHVYLYADRCIMCTRCVRFTREVTGTGELLVQGRGNKEEIGVFPGVALDNELASNVIDLCPVGALLDKDFLFVQRVWFLQRTPSIDGITASGDNLWIEHNEGRVYRVKPRENPRVNKWWITDEVRYGWKHVHADARLRSARTRQFGAQDDCDRARALRDAADGLRAAVARDGRLALLVSPMLPCEEAFLLARAARAADPHALLAVGPVPVRGEDKTFPPGDPDGFRVYAEKCPNSRGVRRVLEALAPGEPVPDFAGFLGALRAGDARRRVSAVLLTGNYPSEWATSDLLDALDGLFVVLLDTLAGRLPDRADVLLPAATWVEKAGTFENARGMLQAFEQAIPPLDGAVPEGQTALDLLHVLERAPTGAHGPRRPAADPLAPPPYDAAEVRRQMAGAAPALAAFAHAVSPARAAPRKSPDMVEVEL